MKYSIFSLARNALSYHERWPLAWRSPAPKPRYDAVIVGGGGHGLATAYYLAKEHGLTNVAVLEKGWLGGGNTGRNTTIVRSNYHLDPNAHFYEFSLKLWEGAVARAQLQRDVQRARRAESRPFAGRHRRRDAPRQRDAPERHRRRVHDARRDRARGSPISIARPTRAFRSRAACCSRAAAPCATTRSPGATRAPPTRCGVDIIQQCEVTGIRIESGAVAGVETTQGFIATPKLGLAVAGHSGHVAAMAGLRLPIESHVLQAMVSEPVKPVLDTVVTSGAVHFYISQSDKGELVMGGDLDFYNSYAQRGNLPVIEHVVSACLALFPSFGRLKLMRTWGGIMDMTMDGSPIIGKLPVKGLYHDRRLVLRRLQGDAGVGLAARAHDRARRAAPLNAAFTLERFAEGRMIDEKGARAATPWAH